MPVTERNWRENWVSWKKRYLEFEKWLATFGLDLPGSLPLSYYPRENWLFIQMLGILFRRPKLLILDETLELLPPEQRQTPGSAFGARGPARRCRRRCRS